MERKISGVEIQYFFTCKTQLWLFAHHINVSDDSEDILIGREIHKYKYERELKEVVLGRVKLDVLRTKDGVTVIERKKAKITRGDVWQLKYYLYLLKKQGLEAKGVLVVPGKRSVVYLSAEDVRVLEKSLKEIEDIIALPSPPKPVKSKYCKKCAYKQFCFAGDEE